VFVSVVWAMDGPRFVAVADARRCQAGDHGRIWLMPTCTPGPRGAWSARFEVSPCDSGWAIGGDAMAAAVEYPAGTLDITGLAASGLHRALFPRL